MKQSFKASTICAIVLLLLCLAPIQAFSADRSVEAFVERVPGVFDRAAHMEKQAELHAWLVRNQVAAALANPIVVELTAADWEAITRDPKQRKILVGVNKKISASIDFNDLNVAQLSDSPQIRKRGAVRKQATGGFVWTAVVRVEGTSGLRLHIKDLSLPAGAELYVYNSAGDAHGPYKGRGPLGTGEFWSHTIGGKELLVQLHHSGNSAPRFQIEAVGALGPRFKAVKGPKPAPQAGDELCNYNASCVVNASCQSSSAVNAAKDAVALILFASGGWYYLCSGGLVADTDSTTQIPYFLTANHCISRSGEASSTEAYFQFETPCGSCNDDFEDNPRTLGATIVSTSKSSDYTLLRLSQSAPGGSAFLGWTSTPIANSNNAPLYRISHPQGAPQAYSEHRVDTSKPTCRSWPRGKWIYSEDILGATEPGSSGSPVVNGSGQIVGQLSGACGFDVNDSCNADDNATVDGAFAAYFSSVEPFLNPGSGGGTCAPAGSACASNSDCCSNKCRGPNNGKTCR